MAVNKKISELTEITTPDDADVQPVVDTSASETKKISWANIKATLKSYFDSLYAAISHTHNASDVNVDKIGTPTYDNVQDLINTTQSAGKLTGGEITDNGDGTVSVSAGTGFIKTTDSDVADTKFFDWSADNSVSLTDNSPNYIYVEYNSGSPQIAVDTSLPPNNNTNVLLGIVYRDGTDLYITTAGQVVSNYAQKTLWKDIYVNGKFQRVDGIMISETGTRNIHITSGLFYAGLTRVNFPEFDSSGTDTFTYYYRDGSGGWTKVTGQTQIDNLHYDDGSGTLATLSDQSGWRKYYGVHWVYVAIDGSVFVVYGQDNYLLSDAENAQPPSSLPGVIESVGMLIGKIVIEKNASSFESIESAFDIYFVPHTVANHNELAGLQGGTTDEYYHLTSAEHTKATQYADSSNDGLLSSSDWIKFDNGLITSITFVIREDPSVISTGEKGHLVIPFDCEIQSVTLLADQIGSIQIDIWKDTYANFPPDDADSICGGNEPAISSAQKYEDSTLTGWTTTINAGDILAFNVDSCTDITRVTIALKVRKT